MLGSSAVRFLLDGVSGSMVLFQEGKAAAVPFTKLMDPKTGKTRVRTVDVNSEVFQVARRYMIRLNPGDLTGQSLQRLAETAHMSPGEFKTRFQDA